MINEKSLDFEIYRDMREVEQDSSVQTQDMNVDKTGEGEDEGEAK